MLKFEPKKYFCVLIETFDVEIAFFINYSLTEMIEYSSKKKKLKKLSEYLNEFKDEEESENILARMYPLKRGYAVRLKFYKNSYRKNIALVAHEISHLVSWVLLDRRIPLSKDSDEIYAYLTEEITQKFLLNWY